MEDLYEYLSKDNITIRHSNSKFNKDSQFWIYAIDDLTITSRSGMSISSDAVYWDLGVEEYVLRKGQYLYIRNNGYPNNMEYDGRFDIGGNLRGLVQAEYKDNSNLVFSFKEAFAGSEVVDASQASIAALGSNIDGLFKSMFKDCKYLKNGIPSIKINYLSNDCCNSMYEGCKSLKRPTIFISNLRDGASVGNRSLQYMYKDSGITDIPDDYFDSLNLFGLKENMVDSMFEGTPLEKSSYSGRYSERICKI